MRIFIIFFTVMFLSFHHKIKAQKDTLFYIGDPMCSWCYGFSPQLDSVLQVYPNLAFEVVVGGLRAEGKETVGSLSSFLKEHWQEIHLKTGRPFRYDILDNTRLVYNTEPACRAVVAVRSVSPQHTYSYFKALQTAFYEENLDPTSLSTFLFLAEKMNIDPVRFEKHFESPVIINETLRDFQLTQTLHVNGFPSLVALINGKLHRISSGYTSAENIIHSLKLAGYQTTEE